MNKIITSRNNKLITDTVKLYNKKYRDREKLFLLEGKKLLREAISAELEFYNIFITEKNIGISEELKNIIPHNRIFMVSEDVYAKLSEEKSPEGILSVVKTIDNFHKRVKIYSYNPVIRKVIILSSLRDPGNLGTIIRSACAFEIDELILSGDCADIYNVKTVRAAMGALFKQKITICDDPAQAVGELRAHEFDVYAAALNRDAVKLGDIKKYEKIAFVIGNEGHGLSDELINACKNSVIIPMADNTESLNASIAASIIMWEVYG